MNEEQVAAIVSSYNLWVVRERLDNNVLEFEGTLRAAGYRMHDLRLACPAVEPSTVGKYGSDPWDASIAIITDGSGVERR